MRQGWRSHQRVASKTPFASPSGVRHCGMRWLGNFGAGVAGPRSPDSQTLVYRHWTRSPSNPAISGTPTSRLARKKLNGVRPPDPRRPSNHAARFGQRRPKRGRATLAFPADVRAAATRDGGDDHVSRQQPMTTRTALGWSVHPLRARAMRQLANISIHTHHTPTRSIAKSRAVRESLLFVVSR
jgi:hypothetical protein